MKSLFDKPVFTFVLGILVSAALGYYFYEKSELERIPVFQTSGIALLANASETKGKLTILRNDKKPIESNVWVLGFYFWNAGTKEILAKDILRDISISLPKDHEIIEVKITNQSRGQVVKGRITKAEKQSFGLDFAVLEPKDAIAGQLIYEGPSATSLKVDGAILGAKSIAREGPITAESAGRRIWKFVLGIAVLLGVVVATFGSVAIIVKLYTRFLYRPGKYLVISLVGRKKFRTLPKLSDIVGISIVGGLILLVVYLVTASIVEKSKSSPPIEIFQDSGN